MANAAEPLIVDVVELVAKGVYERINGSGSWDNVHPLFHIAARREATAHVEALLEHYTLVPRVRPIKTGDTVHPVGFPHMVMTVDSFGHGDTVNCDWEAEGKSHTGRFERSSLCQVFAKK